MNRDEITAAVVAELTQIAPEAAGQAIQPDVSFHDQFELDSVDFLRLMTALEARLGVEIMDLDYPQLGTLNGCAAYLSQRLAA